MSLAKKRSPKTVKTLPHATNLVDGSIGTETFGFRNLTAPGQWAALREVHVLYLQTLCMAPIPVNDVDQYERVSSRNGIVEADGLPGQV